MDISRTLDLIALTFNRIFVNKEPEEGETIYLLLFDFICAVYLCVLALIIPAITPLIYYLVLQFLMMFDHELIPSIL